MAGEGHTMKDKKRPDGRVGETSRRSNLHPDAGLSYSFGYNAGSSRSKPLRNAILIEAL